MRGGRMIPWFVSGAIHALLVALLFSVGIVTLRPWVQRDDATTLGGATFRFEAAPVERTLVAPATVHAPSPVAEPRGVSAKAMAVAQRASTGVREHAQRVQDDATSRLDRPVRSIDLPRSVLSVAGVRADVAHRIVFLLDASGSMIGAYRTAVQEIIDAIARLNEEQQFAIVVFQRGEAFLAPPESMRRAGPTLGQRGLQELSRWLLDEINPGGGSHPLKAMRVSMALKPDTVVIVSAGLLGAADSASDRDALLAEFDALNPADALTRRRPVQLACIHLLQPEPLGALAEIARLHGGPNSYRFVGRMSDIRGSHDASISVADETTLRMDEASAIMKAGDVARARTQFLRIGLGEPLHSSAPTALVCAAEIALLTDHDRAGAALLARASLQGARAFGLRATEARAESVLRASNEPNPTPREETQP